jgi:hypothetical protein
LCIGIVATGIDDHEVQAIAGVIQRCHHRLGAHGVDLDVALTLDHRVYRHEVVDPVDLDTVASVEEKPDSIAPAFVELVAEIANGALHRLLIRVGMLNDVESEAAQGRRHEGGVIGRVDQRRTGVGAVADNQRHPSLGAGGTAWCGTDCHAQTQQDAVHKASACPPVRRYR